MRTRYSLAVVAGVVAAGVLPGVDAVALTPPTTVVLETATTTTGTAVLLGRSGSLGIVDRKTNANVVCTPSTIKPSFPLGSFTGLGAGLQRGTVPTSTWNNCVLGANSPRTVAHVGSWFVNFTNPTSPGTSSSGAGTPGYLRDFRVTVSCPGGNPVLVGGNAPFRFANATASGMSAKLVLDYTQEVPAGVPGVKVISGSCGTEFLPGDPVGVRGIYELSVQSGGTNPFAVSASA